jgi:hypothetical protein
MRQSRSVSCQPIQRRRVHIPISQGRNRVEPLLIGTVPKDVRGLVWHVGNFLIEEVWQGIVNECPEFAWAAVNSDSTNNQAGFRKRTAGNS